MHFKKTLRKLCVLLLISAMCTAGCAARTTAENAAQNTNGHKVIVTTIFPLYDWTDNLLGPETDAELVMMLDSGVDLHSFQPTAQDIMKIATCDLFLYVGGESDDWVEDALRESVNPDMVAVNLLDALGDRAKTEEIVEGMEDDHHGEEDHDAAPEHEEEGDHEEEEGHTDDGEMHADEYDEHVWLSLKNASFLTGVIAGALKQIDPENAARYDANLSAYREALYALDKEYETVMREAPVKTLLFGDRFPFRYLTDDYGLSYYAAFAGCSAETEASFETVTFLSGKTDELNLKHVMMIEGGDGKIAQTIVKNTDAKDQEILALNSMQGTTGQDVRDGTTYFAVMESNLEVLKEALGVTK